MRYGFIAPALSSVCLGALLSGCAMMDLFSSSENTEPPAELVEFTPSLEIRTVWSTSVGDGSAGQLVELVPFLYQGRLFVADRDGEVKALDATTGKEDWAVETDLPISAGPGAGEGVVLLGTSDAQVVALDETSGERKWRTAVSSEVLSVPAVSEGVVVVQTIDGKVAGLDLNTGERRWIYERSVPVLTLRGTSSPVIGGGQVICGFASGRLVALDLHDGIPVWDVSIATPSGRSELERMVDIDGDPAVQDGIIYVATFQGDLAAVSQDTGIVLWRREISSYTEIGVDWRYLYLTDAQDSVWAFDFGNGSAVWRQKKLHGRRLSGPAILEDYVVVGDFEGYLHWLDAEDGHMLARSRVGSAPIGVRPRVVGDTVYVYNEDGDLAALTVEHADTDQ